MAWSSKYRAFGVDSPVLSFLKRYPRHIVSKRYLLWPAWHYRVVVPMERSQILNILQKAVLGLCAAGLRRASDISTRLHLHLELVAHILTELRDFNLVDRTGAPTARGREALDDETLVPTELRVLSVFQDPWTGDLWPRCMERLEYASLDRSRSPFPALQLGSTGKPWVEQAFWHLPPSGCEPNPPVPVEILQAARRHRLAIRIAEGKETAPLDPDDDESNDYLDQEDYDPDGEPWATIPQSQPSVPVSGVERVTCIDQEPQAVFLVTYLCLTASDGDEHGWEVADPFGIGASAKLRRMITKQIDRSPLLRRPLEELLGNELDRQLESNEQFLRTLRAKAELEVTRELYDDVRRWNGWEDLLDIAMSRIELAQAQGSHREAVSRRALSAGRRLLERIFGELRERYPISQVWEKVYVRHSQRNWCPHSDPNFVRGRYNAAARRIGLHTPLPDPLLSVKPGDVRSAALYDDAWRLRPRIVATLLGAEDVPDHPLATVARKEPTFLTAVEQVVLRTGAAAHVGTLTCSHQELEDTVAEVYRIIGLLRPTTQ